MDREYAIFLIISFSDSFKKCNLVEIRIERESSNQRKFNEIETAENSIGKLAKRSFWL